MSFFLTISFSLSLSLSLSLSNNIAPKVRCQRLQVFKGCLANTPTPHTPLQVSSSSRNFIRAGFLYKLITPEGTSHLLSVWGGEGRGCWVWWNIFIRGCCFARSAPPPPPYFSFLFLSSSFFNFFFCLFSSQNLMTNAL